MIVIDINERPRKVHYIKCDIEYFFFSLENKKTFELRINDRDYFFGDLVAMVETVDDEVTGRVLLGKISYVLKDVEKYGLDKEYCVFQVDKWRII